MTPLKALLKALFGPMPRCPVCGTYFEWRGPDRYVVGCNDIECFRVRSSRLRWFARLRWRIAVWRWRRGNESEHR